MRLRSIRIENFRALTYASIGLDATTVLIGENDCGRSSVMEAVALALGWNSADGEFQFRPHHSHRSQPLSSPDVPAISITLEFCESALDEWAGEGFGALRTALPGVLSGDRQFWFRLTHRDDATHWIFHSSHDRLNDDRPMLRWLRRRMPVLWMAEGMLSGRHVGAELAQLPDAADLAIQVTQHYRALLDGTALDVTAAIDQGSSAARQLLLARAKLQSRDSTPFGELLEEITGRQTTRDFTASDEVMREHGTASHRLGMLLLTGALLQSGAGQLEPDVSPLVLIENPEANLHPMTLASIWTVIERIGGQKIIATHSGTLLARARLSSIRRLTRHEGAVKTWYVPEGALTADELRRYSYHLRSRRAASSFARCWMLVEGETEYWLMGELARVCGYDLASEGVTCVEFAQCGLSSVLKVAGHLGVNWHLLADGDMAGQRYVEMARACTEGDESPSRFTLLPQRDIEHCFWECGYQNVFRSAAWPNPASADVTWQRRAPARRVIAHAIDRYSKPWLAVLLLDAVIDRGREGVPPPLRQAIETCVAMARRPA